MLQDFTDDGVIICSKEARSFHCLYQPVPTYFLFIREDAHTTAIGLFRIGGRVQDAGNIITNHRSDSSCPAGKFFRVPFTYKLVGGTQVVLGSGISIFFDCSWMIGNTLTVIKDGYLLRAVNQFYFTSNEAVGYTVIMLVFIELNVSAFHYRDLFISLDPVGFRR